MMLSSIASAAEQVSKVTEVKLPVQSTSILDLFFQAEPMVQIIMLLLLFLSVYSWTIIFTKMKEIKANKNSMEDFQYQFWHTPSLAQLHNQVMQGPENILSETFTASVEELELVLSDVEAGNASTEMGLERVERIMEMASFHAVNKIRKRLSFLATLASSAPFIGLLGTVWGIMHSFQSIAVAKNASLSVVAPGIAEALLATALGLAAAIPALIFYNKFTNDIDSLANECEEFKLQLTTLMIRRIEQKK